MAQQAGSVALNVVAETSGVQVGMVNAATISERELKRIGQYVAAVSQQQKQWTSTVQQAATVSAASYEKVTQAAKKMEGGHAGVNRELIVMAHELSQGNFKNLAGSAMVLAEKINFLEFAMTGVGAATLGVGAAVLGSIGAMVMGAVEADKFAKALQLTGNYAAVTDASIADMAQRQKQLTGQSIGGARESIETVAGTGRFGPQAVEQVARAMGDYQKLTHASAEEALKVFDSLSDGAAKWAERTNASMHFLSLAQYDQIKALEEAGDKQGAAAMAASMLAQTLEARGTPAVGLFARRWHEASEAIGGAIDNMKAVARGDNLSDAIARQQKLVDGLKVAISGKGLPAFGSFYFGEDDMKKDLARREAVIAELKKSQDFAQQAAARQSKNQQTQDEAIQGKAYEEGVLRSAKALSARTAELKKWDDQRAKDAAAGSPMSDTDYKAGRTDIMNRYADHSAAAQLSDYTRLIERINAFNRSTDEQIERQGKLSEGDRFAIQMHEALANSTAKLSAAQRQTISGLVDAAAARETDLEQSLKLRAALKDEADTVLKADAAAFASRQASVQGFKRSVQEKVAAIDFETSLIGKSVEEAARMQQEQSLQLAAAHAIEAVKGAQLTEVLAIEAEARTNLAAATERQRATQEAYNASFSAGWDKATQDYVKAANNSAAQGQQVFESAMRASEDAVVRFAETGKLSFKSLGQSIIDTVIRIQVQKGFSALFGGGGGGGFNFGSLFGGASGGSSSGLGNAGYGDYSNAGLASAFGYANGLDYVPYDGFPAILHEGEKVMRRQDAALERSSSGGHVFHFENNINVGQGVNRAEVTAAVQQGNAQVKADITRQVRIRGGL
jgi:lambda family phage tail tape measure protein